MERVDRYVVTVCCQKHNFYVTRNDELRGDPRCTHLIRDTADAAASQQYSTRYANSNAYTPAKKLSPKNPGEPLSECPTNLQYVNPSAKFQYPKYVHNKKQTRIHTAKCRIDVAL